jgi:hypothetical protein
MGQFLRDQRVKNVTIDEPALIRLNEAFLARVLAHNATVPEAETPSCGPKAPRNPR